MISTNTLLIAFSLSLLAGISTTIGGLMVYFTKHTNTKVLAVALGLSAGVMIYVSFTELLFQAQKLLTPAFSIPKIGGGITILAFFGGITVAALIDRLLPGHPHEIHRVEEMEHQVHAGHDKLLRTGFITFIAITAHNFPEGMATFTSAIQNISLGIAITIAVAIHNIPEGISIAIPIFYATGSRKKALYYTFLSGFAEPLGAIIGYALFAYLFNNIALGVMFATVAGIMVFISFDQLLPAAHKYGEHHLAIYGLLSGMAVMAVSLLLLV
jgi:ZIP family zinc transporter